MSSSSVKQECPVKNTPQECQARVSRKECQERGKSVQQEYSARVSRKSVKKECQARVSSKSVKQECLPRVSSKRVLSRVPCKTLLLLDDCASHLHKEKTSIFISALVSVHSALHKVTAFGFVGSIRFSSCALPFVDQSQFRLGSWHFLDAPIPGFTKGPQSSHDDTPSAGER